MADIEARVNENSPIGFFTWCWTIVVEITDGRSGSSAGRLAVSYAASLSLGRPPRVPFSRDALALAALRAEPPSSPICCIHRREPKAPSMSAGT
jgi:hypothetical protein